MRAWYDSGAFEAEFERLKAERDRAQSSASAPSAADSIDDEHQVPAGPGEQGHGSDQRIADPEAQTPSTAPVPDVSAPFSASASAETIAESTVTEDSWRSQLRGLKATTPSMQDRYDRLADFEERWRGRLPSGPEERREFERQAQGIGVGKKTLQSTEPYMDPELHGYLVQRADHAEQGQASVDRIKGLRQQMPDLKQKSDADPLNLRGTADDLRRARADLRFDRGYVERVKADHNAGVYTSREHERAEHIGKQVSSRVADLDGHKPQPETPLQPAKKPRTEAQQRILDRQHKQRKENRKINESEKQDQDQGMEM